MKSQEQLISVGVPLNEKLFADSHGLFPLVRAGQLTSIVNNFCENGQ